MQWNTQKMITVNIKIIKFRMAAKISVFATFAIHTGTHNFTDLSVSPTMRQPLIFFVAFVII